MKYIVGSGGLEETFASVSGETICMDEGKDTTKTC